MTTAELRAEQLNARVRETPRPPTYRDPWEKGFARAVEIVRTATLWLDPTAEETRRLILEALEREMERPAPRTPVSETKGA
jgi:hypothetical protein